MRRDKQRRADRKELANLTVSMVLSFTYMVIVCWIVPIAPMIIIWLADWTFSDFLTLWLVGLPFACLPLYYLVKKK
ncbi:MAG: hypothetical protein OEZ24_01895 [Candidatus Bathyarchaeota archaeon]|nr:hypothetical protein [Candidatus Bathyarchaeota archaeon]